MLRICHVEIAKASICCYALQVTASSILQVVVRLQINCCGGCQCSSYILIINMNGVHIDL